MIKAVLFDLDRTLLDRDSAVVAFAQQQYLRFRSILQQISEEAYVARFVDLDNRGYAAKDRVYQQLVAELSLKPLMWRDFFEDFKLNFKQCCVTFPGTKIVLSQLREANLQLGIVTNGSSQQMTNIQAIGIQDFFEVILVSEQEGVRKPEPEIFIRALAKLKTSTSETVFVGDNPIADIAGASQVGMKTIWKCDPDEVTSQPHGDGVIKYITDLPALLAELNYLSL